MLKKLSKTYSSSVQFAWTNGYKNTWSVCAKVLKYGVLYMRNSIEVWRALYVQQY